MSISGWRWRSEGGCGASEHACRMWLYQNRDCHPVVRNASVVIAVEGISMTMTMVMIIIVVMGIDLVIGIVGYGSARFYGRALRVLPLPLVSILMPAQRLGARELS